MDTARKIQGEEGHLQAMERGIKRNQLCPNLISDCPHYDEKTHGCCLGVQSVVLCTGSPSKLTAFKLGVTANPWFIVSIYLLVIRLF